MNGCTGRREFLGLTEDWLSYLRDVKRLSEKTLEGYETDVVEIFGDYLSAAWARFPAMEMLTPNDLEDFVAWRAKEGSRQTGLQISETTIRRNCAGIRSFLKWCYRRGHTEKDLCSLWDMPRKPRKKALEYLTPEQIGVLLGGPFEAASKHLWVQERDRALVWTLAFTGLRPCEIVRLKAEDFVDSSVQCALVVRETKSREDRMQPVNRAALAPVLRAYMEVRPDAPDGWMFPSVFSLGRLSELSVWRRVKSHASRCGIDRAIPKMFRSGFAMKLLAEEKNAVLVQKALGHRDLKSTMSYVEARREEVACAVDAISYG